MGLILRVCFLVATISCVSGPSSEGRRAIMFDPRPFAPARTGIGAGAFVEDLYFYAAGPEPVTRADLEALRDCVGGEWLSAAAPGVAAVTATPLVGRSATELIMRVEYVLRANDLIRIEVKPCVQLRPTADIPHFALPNPSQLPRAGDSSPNEVASLMRRMGVRGAASCPLAWIARGRIASGSDFEIELETSERLPAAPAVFRTASPPDVARSDAGAGDGSADVALVRQIEDTASGSRVRFNVDLAWLSEAGETVVVGARQVNNLWQSDGLCEGYLFQLPGKLRLTATDDSFFMFFPGGP